jgi:hypothetical protein
LKKEESVQQLIAALDHPLKEVVIELRKIILESHPEVAEQVKWNSPSFYYTGEMAPFDPKEYKRDIIVFHLRKNDHILLIFPTGARFTDASGLLEGKFTDGRKMAKFGSLDEVNNRGEDLKKVIKKWVDTVEK